jgi:CubicO group peptidase (beta-lactamase class C family)
MKAQYKKLRLTRLLSVALLAGCGLAIASAADPTSSAASLIGLWAGGLTLPPSAHGELMIDGRKSEWRATILGISAPVRRDKDAVAFVLPNNAGEFRGRIVDSKTIHGHWIQPANEINDNRYATPVELLQAGDKIWHGNVEPLQGRLSLFMSIQRGDDGSIMAVIRNPELNLFRRNVYRVDATGNRLTFSDAKNPSQFDATLNESASELRARLPNIDKEIAFKPRKIADAAGFRPIAGRDYNYDQPVATHDGWATARLSDVDLDSKLILVLVEKILHVDPLDNPFPIHSLLIARHGKLVADYYFYGYDEDRPHDMRSASKTFTPMLVGIARDRGAKIDIDTPGYAQFSEYKNFANPDPRKSRIMVRDLMTMTSGLACDDNDDASPGNEDNMQQQKAQPDWYKYALDLPMVRDPGGEKAVYCSAGINLLGGLVRNATHTWLPEFFYENVAKPLQIQTYHWNLMPSGDGYAGGGLYLRPRDQLKLGQLYLNGGNWNGKRIVSKDWAERSTSRQSSFGPTLGADHDYGYGWHLYHFEVGGRSYRAYGAGGNGGQIVMVIPDLDLVVGFTGGAYGEFAKWYKWQLELVPQFIIPAAVRSSG